MCTYVIFSSQCVRVYVHHCVRVCGIFVYRFVNYKARVAIYGTESHLHFAPVGQMGAGYHD